MDEPFLDQDDHHEQHNEEEGEEGETTLRVNKHRRIPLSVILHTLFVGAMVMVAVAISVLIFYYAKRTLTPISHRLCSIVAVDIANRMTETAMKWSEGTRYLDDQYRYVSTTLAQVITCSVTLQEITQWGFADVSVAIIPLSEKETATVVSVHDRELWIATARTTASSNWTLSTTYLTGHGLATNDTDTGDLSTNHTSVSRDFLAARSSAFSVNLSEIAAQRRAIYNNDDNDSLTVHWDENGQVIITRGTVNNTRIYLRANPNFTNTILHGKTTNAALAALMAKGSRSDQTVVPIQIGIINRRTGRWVLTDVDSPSVTLIPPEWFPSTSAVPCTDFIRLDGDVYYISCTHIQKFGLHLISVALVRETVVHSEIYHAIENVVLIFGATGLGLFLLSAVLVRMIAKPFGNLSKKMEALSRMKLEYIHDQAPFRELDEMHRAFDHMVAQLEHLKHYLPDGDPVAEISSVVSEGDSSASPKSSPVVVKKLSRIAVELTFVSRKTEDTKEHLRFDFEFRIDDPNLFDTLVHKCRRIVGEHPHQLVRLYAHISGERDMLVLENTQQLHQAMSMTHEVLELTMTKGGKKNIIVPLAAVTDVVNVFSTLYFAIQVVRESDADLQISGTTFMFLYFFAFAGNLMISWMLMRSACDDDAAMARWMSAYPLESAITAFVSMINTQNLQLLWSEVRVRHWLRFNAPYSNEFFRRSVVWSIFGFVFCDCMQLVFKVYVGQKSGYARVALSLVTSSASMMFSMVKRLSALWLWQKNSMGGNVGVTSVSRRSGNNNVAAMDMRCRDVTVIYFMLHHPDMAPLSQLVGIELQRAYDLLFRVSRGYGGVVVSFMNGDAVVGFNMIRNQLNHTQNAVLCALELTRRMHLDGLYGICALSLEPGVLVGSLGSNTRRGFHCFASSRRLRRIALTGAWHNVDIACTSGVADALTETRVVTENGDVVTAVRIDELTEATHCPSVFSVSTATLRDDFRPEYVTVAPEASGVARLLGGIGMPVTASKERVRRAVFDARLRLQRVQKVLDAEARAQVVSKAIDIGAGAHDFVAATSAAPSAGMNVGNLLSGVGRFAAMKKKV